MKRFFKAILLSLILAFSFYFVGCSNRPVNPILPPEDNPDVPGEVEKPDDNTDDKKDQQDDNTENDEEEKPDVIIEFLDKELTDEQKLSRISFVPTTFSYDGNPHSVLVNEKYLPSGYTVSYTDNTQTEVGSYHAQCDIKDSKGDIVKTLHTIITIDICDNEEFNKFVDEFFVLYIEGDQLSVNIFMCNPSDFGITEHYDATWYTYEKSTPEDIEEGINQLKDLQAELKSFDTSTLSKNDMISYRCIEEFLNNNLKYYDNPKYEYMSLEYIDQFGGMPADFATYMEAYAIRTEQDVKDIISYTLSLPDAFSSYIEYVKDKENAGYAISQFTIDEMAKYLKEVIDDGDNYYLTNVVCKNINRATCLTDAQKTDYTTQFKNAMASEFKDAYTILYNYLKDYKSPVTTEGYLQTYEYGSDYYILKLKDLLGVETIDIDQYIAFLDKKIKSASSGIDIAMMKANKYKEGYNDFVNYATGARSLVYLLEPDEMLYYLKDFAYTIVPELQTNPKIKLAELDPTVQERTTTVAYYMKSALDSTDIESIHTNPHFLSEDINDTLSTLGHEGYPGHLYNFVYTKESNMSNLAKIMTNTCYGEGWATYVSLALYRHIKANTTDKAIQYACDYLINNEIIGYALYARIDAGIHLENWKEADIKEYLDSKGFNGDAAKDVYRTLIEIPTQYVSYGFGICLFDQLHTDCKKELGNYYDEVSFNKMILDLGWCNMETLYNSCYEYINQCKILYGLN